MIIWIFFPVDPNYLCIVLMNICTCIYIFVSILVGQSEKASDKKKRCMEKNKIKKLVDSHQKMPRQLFSSEKYIIIEFPIYCSRLCCVWKLQNIGGRSVRKAYSKAIYKYTIIYYSIFFFFIFFCVFLILFYYNYIQAVRNVKKKKSKSKVTIYLFAKTYSFNIYYYNSTLTIKFIDSTISSRLIRAVNECVTTSFNKYCRAR